MVMNITARMHQFIVIAQQDERLSTSHLIIYLALCVKQSEVEEHIPFSISRRQIMHMCKIRGLATYHKCIKDLERFGYIDYVPSYHPAAGSLVTLNDFELVLLH